MKPLCLYITKRDRIQDSRYSFILDWHNAGSLVVLPEVRRRRGRSAVTVYMGLL